MDEEHTTELLERLLAARDADERRDVLNDHVQRRGRLDARFFEQLRERVRDLVERDGERALRVTAVGLEAAKLAEGTAGIAQAWWARGNALLFLGEYDDCLSAYSMAIALFAGEGLTGEVAQLQSNCMLPLMWTGRHAEAQAMGHSALSGMAATLEHDGETSPQVANLRLNLSICALYQGDHTEALDQTAAAAEIFERLGDEVQAARCRVTQSVALESMDRFTEAEMLLRKALAVLADHGAGVPWARAALNLAVLHARLADHQAALGWLAESRQAFIAAGIEVDAAVVDLYRARCLLDVNLLPEAMALCEELVETFTRLKMVRQEARAATLLAKVYTRRRDLDRARQALDRARQVFAKQQDGVEVALLDLHRAALLREMRQPGAALRLATEAVDTLDVGRYPLRHAEAHLIVAACCEDLGRIEEAQVAYRIAWEAGSHPTESTEPPPVLAYRIAHARGVIAEAAGERALARGEYGRAVEYLRRIARGLGLDELRGGFLADKRSVYEAALRLAWEDDRIADAFRISELARAGTLRDCLAGKSRIAQNQTGMTQAVGEMDDLAALKARWAWRVSALQQPVDLMAEVEEEAPRPEDRSARLRELAEIERALADAYRRRRLSDPRLAVLEQGEVLGLDAVRRQLPLDAALLAFDHVDGQTLAFVITRERAEIVPVGSLSSLRWEAAGLGHALEEVRLFDDPADLAWLQADLLADLQALYRAVLAKPLARLGPDVARLWIVPGDVLYTLPLEACHDGRRYLLERYAVSYLPAASVLEMLPHSQPGEPDSPLVLAHSWDDRLPWVQAEAEGVARALASGSAAQLLTGESATADVLRARAGAAGLIHVAAHGAFREDAPLFSSLHLADGPLTVNEVYSLDLSRTALVTLSGCQTGLGQGRGGEMLGLTHAVFFAGAPRLVVSRWRVEDETTAQLMADFYTELARGVPVAEALRVAQLSLLARRPHAGYWAAFAAWGRGFDPIF